MEIFNIETQKAIMSGDVGYPFLLSRSFAAAEQANGLSTSAIAFFNAAVKCLIVGLTSPAEQLLKKAEEWLLYAIKNNEKLNRYFLHATEASRYYTLSLLNWMIRNSHDTNSLRQSTEFRDLYLSDIQKWDKIAISMILPEYFDAGRYSRAIEIFEKTPGFHLPKQINRIKTEGAMICIMCRHQLEIDDRRDELAIGIQAFLNRNMNQWLVNGHFDVAARWMKIVYWKQGSTGISSRDALMKCLCHV